jgi:hypothetical protein
MLTTYVWFGLINETRPYLAAPASRRLTRPGQRPISTKNRILKARNALCIQAFACKLTGADRYGREIFSRENRRKVATALGRDARV